MSYTALYRAFRPQKFSEVIGQEHISITLKNAIKQNRVAHAYLFCGPRGTGKTSSAKILAKAVNCLNLTDDEPCNECTNCQAINAGNFLDVLEIDAASNRGIDEIRDIRDKVKFAPSQGKVKVYIIDEVHMLTSEAFNALLKTLEEPPGHVLFILATTEAQKIPLTILSRCQRFDYRKISTNEIKEHLLTIVNQEEINIEESALNTIARKAAGGMRDAISVLDQCIAFAGNNITSDHVEKVLGTLGEEQILNISNAISQKDAGKAITLLNEYLQSGKDVKQVVRDLSEFYRQIMLLKLASNSELISINEEILPQAKEQANLVSMSFLGGLILKLNQIEREMRWTSQPQVLLEAGLVEVIFQGNKITEEEQPAMVVKTKPIENDTNQKYKSNDRKIPKQESSKNKTVQAGNQGDFLEIKRRWADVLEKVKQIKVTTHAFLVVGEPKGIDEEGRLILSFKEMHKFHFDQISKPDHKVLVEKAINEVLGIDINLTYILDGQVTNGSKTPENSVVEKALEFFGGNIVEIKE
ncbi:MAG: DNA polymerase III subunit gamma/tau [Peptococcales bacterium]